MMRVAGAGRILNNFVVGRSSMLVVARRPRGVAPGAAGVGALGACRNFSASSAPIDLEANPHFFLVRDVISEGEEAVLLAYLDPLLRRRRYEDGHWDSVISNFKEVELLAVSRGKPMPAEVQSILLRVQELIQRNYPFAVPQLLAPHCIDLNEETGAIDYHVDSAKHSGGVLAGLSLLAQRTMRLKPDDINDENSANANRGVQDVLQKGVVWSAAEVRDLLLLQEKHTSRGGSGSDSKGDCTPPSVAEAQALAQAQAQAQAQFTTDWPAVAHGLNTTDVDSKDKKFLRSAAECRAKARELQEGQHQDGIVESPATAPTPAPAIGNEGSVSVLQIELPRRSLYLLDGPLRYSYAHAIDSGDRRVSIIFRDPHDDPREDTGGLRKVLPETS